MRRFILSGAMLLLLSAWCGTTQAQCGGTACGDVACCNPCCGCPENYGFTGGVDLTFFRLYGQSGAGGGGASGGTDDMFPDYNTAIDGRLWIGYEMQNGVGLRARFVEWEGTERYVGSARTADFEIYDIEATLDVTYGNWDFTGFAGFRFGSIELNSSDFGESHLYDFDGAGLTIGGDFNRPLFGEVALIGGVRYSVLYGNTEFRPNPAVLSHTYVDITEVRLGLEWSRELGRGRFFASAAWEQQVYGTDTYFPFAIDPESHGDVSLGGPVFSIGIDR